MAGWSCAEEYSEEPVRSTFGTFTGGLIGVSFQAWVAVIRKLGGFNTFSNERSCGFLGEIP